MQVAAAQPLRQGLQGTGTRTCRDGVSPQGAFSTGSVGPSSCTTGVPTSDATCIGPLSEPMKRRLAANTSARSARLGVAGASVGRPLRRRHHGFRERPVRARRAGADDAADALVARSARATRA